MPARRLTRKVRNREGRLLAEGARVFLPQYLDQVRAIAMRGLGEDKISELFDISRSQIGVWKKQYPTFKQALEEGHTDADAAVLSALYQSAVGYTHDEEKIFQWDGDIIRADTVKHYKPDIGAIKLWLTNRQKEHWKDRHHSSVSGGSSDDSPIGLRDETKLEVMNSILALVQPKDDNVVTIDGRTGKIEETDNALKD
jgi:hypothetical protein